MGDEDDEIDAEELEDLRNPPAEEDDDCPVVEVSLEHFLNVQEDIAAEDAEAGAKFALTGKDADNTCCAHLNPKRPTIVPIPLEAANIRRRFDVDSFRGILEENDRWPFTKALEVFPIPRHSDTVRRTSRLKLGIEGKMVSAGFL